MSFDDIAATEMFVVPRLARSAVRGLVTGRQIKLYHIWPLAVLDDMA